MYWSKIIWKKRWGLQISATTNMYEFLVYFPALWSREKRRKIRIQSRYQNSHQYYSRNWGVSYPNPSSLLPKACIFCALPPTCWHGLKGGRHFFCNTLRRYGRQNIRLLGKCKWRDGKANLYTGQAEELFPIWLANTHF